MLDFCCSVPGDDAVVAAYCYFILEDFLVPILTIEIIIQVRNGREALYSYADCI